MQYHHVMTPHRRMMVFNVPGYTPKDEEIIDTGRWLPDLIKHRLPNDAKMMASIYKWDTADRFPLDTAGDRVFWADASGITAIKVELPKNMDDIVSMIFAWVNLVHGTVHQKGWGLPFDVLGLEVTNTPKLAKRLKEILRISRFNFYSRNSKRIRLAWVDIRDNDEKHYDGVNLLSRSFAEKMGLKSHHVRGNFRLLLPEGLVKGDAIIISDYQMLSEFGHLFDVVAPKVNLKSELRTTGWGHATFNPHHAHNQAMFDVQSVSWLREWLYPRDLIKQTLTTAIDTALESLRNGEWPSWMVMAETQAHLDSDSTLRDLENAGEAFRRHYLRWQMHGMKPEHSASIMGMAANGFLQRLQSRLDIRNNSGEWKPMMWLPLPWAVYGHIMTHEFLQLSGYTIPKGCEDKLFFHEESASFSMPGKMFALFFERHGTWDLDDSAKFFAREVAEDAWVEGEFFRKGEAVAVIVRSPNSDGEYSIIKIGNIEDFPLYHTYGDPPSIDLNRRPKFIEEVLANQQVDGLPEDTRQADSEYSFDEARYSVDIQAENPGVGGVANAMMVTYASTGKSPARVIDTMGNIVDLVQQTPHLKGFKATKAFTDELWDGIVAHGKVDWYLHLTRVPPRAKEILGTYDGYFTVLFNFYRKEVKRFRELSRLIAFQKRAANPIPEIMGMSDLPIPMAGKWVRHAEARFAKVNQDFGGNTPQMKARRTKENRQVIRDMVDKLNSMEESEANKLTLAMYRFCVTPGADASVRFGRSDRALFGPVDEGEESVMDIFIRALIDIGVAHEVDPRVTAQPAAT